MRRILIDGARRRTALRRGGQAERVEMDGLEIPMAMEDDQLLAMHEALIGWANSIPPKRNW